MTELDSKQSDSAQPTLLIVMGTSGSGKSTVGMALAEALSCPFVDGDDLHPIANVQKMSAGHPLNDEDREPWLKTIRKTGLQLTTSSAEEQEEVKAQAAGNGDTDVRKLAEVYETSQHSDQNSTRAHSGSQSTSSQSDNASTRPKPSSRRQMAVIACSALKLAYRQLIRGSVSTLSQSAPQPETVQDDLEVIHVYLNLSRKLLEERMTNRKGHFMKLDMLYSQLDTLQPPSTGAEPHIIVVDVESQTSTDDIVKIIHQRLSDEHAL